MRLLQVDIAVKDNHFPATGWTFSTFVYDERMYPAEPNGWKRLVPVGIMWGNDPAVTGTVTVTASPRRSTEALTDGSPQADSP